MECNDISRFGRIKPRTNFCKSAEFVIFGGISKYAFAYHEIVLLKISAG
jgi:hypothetical protein